MDKDGNIPELRCVGTTHSDATKTENESNEDAKRELQNSNTNVVKRKIENELLIKLGAKEEEFDWHPDILTRRSERPKSSVSLDYPLDLKVGTPKSGHMSFNRNPWFCNNQALRQMTLVSRHGPKLRYYNRPQFCQRNEVNILKIS